MKNIYFLIITSIIWGCDSNDEQQFNSSQAREELVNEIISPIHEQLDSTVQILNASILELVEVPNPNQLDEVKAIWKDCAYLYSQTEIYNVNEVRNSLVHYSLYSWPAQVQMIENYLANEDLNTLNINSIPTGTRGVAALEYLLFHESENHVLERLTTEEYAQYLTMISENLVSKTQALHQTWLDQEGTFINNEETDINGSLNQLINQVINTLAVLRKDKISIPSGIEYGTIDSDLVQAPYSKISLMIIEGNLRSIESMYFNHNYALSDRVENLASSEVNNAIQNSFDEAYQAIEDMESSLFEAVNQQPEKVESLHTAVESLLRYFSADVASSLSIIVTPTDADGD